MLCTDLCLYLSYAKNALSCIFKEKSRSLISTSGAHNVFWESGSLYLMLLVLPFLF